MFQKCKITVIKKSCDRDLVNAYVKHPENVSICTRIEEGQEFIISSPFEMPAGICEYAWADIRPQILSIASGGTFSFLKDKKSALAVCSDLFRPVVFKIETMDD